MNDYMYSNWWQFILHILLLNALMTATAVYSAPAYLQQAVVELLLRLVASTLGAGKG